MATHQVCVICVHLYFLPNPCLQIMMLLLCLGVRTQPISLNGHLVKPRRAGPLTFLGSWAHTSVTQSALFFECCAIDSATQLPGTEAECRSTRLVRVREQNLSLPEAITGINIGYKTASAYIGPCIPDID